MPKRNKRQGRSAKRQAKKQRKEQRVQQEHEQPETVTFVAEPKIGAMKTDHRATCYGDHPALEYDQHQPKEHDTDGDNAEMEFFDALEFPPTSLAKPVSARCCRSCALSSNDVTLQYCDRCFGVWYCSKGCQKDDWKYHRKACESLCHERDLARKIQKGGPLSDFDIHNPQLRVAEEMTGLAFDEKFFELVDVEYKSKLLAAGLEAPHHLQQIYSKFGSCQKKYGKYWFDRIPKLLMRELRSNRDRFAIQNAVYGSLDDNLPPEIHALILSREARENGITIAFFEEIAKTIESDIARLEGLPMSANESYVGVLPSLSILTNVHFSRKCMTVEEVSSSLVDQYSCQMFLQTQCWALQLHLTVTCAKLLRTQGFGNCRLQQNLSLMWRRTFYLFCQYPKEFSSSIFENSYNPTNLPIYNYRHATTAPLLELLNFDGPQELLESFKLPLYGVTAVLCRRSFTSDDFPATDEDFEMVTKGCLATLEGSRFCETIKEFVYPECYSFLSEVVMPLVSRILRDKSLTEDKKIRMLEKYDEFVLNPEGMHL